MTELLQEFGWRNLLDIVVIALIFSWLAALLKRGVAIRLLAGAGVLFAGYFASTLLGLDVCRSLFSRLIDFLPVILVVIFNGDIRRALMAPPRSSRSAGEMRDENSELIEELVIATVSLSERHTGALIVIEKEMAVDPHVAVGTVIDAKVTSELITSIFLPYSPIHDGALIIQKGKLTMAGCFLPLSQDRDISKALGTRHRAAIGLTELVDAVVVVVSEETGGISLVTGGHLTFDLDTAGLRKALRKEMGEF